MQPEPKVTVFIPVYNRAAYVKTAIDSILAQSFGDFEILAIDDCSTDDSAAIVAGIGNPRIRLVRNETNLGIPATRNKGLALARGEYFALLDSDDYAFPERLARQSTFLDRHPDFAAVGTWGGFMDEQGRRLKKRKRHPASPLKIHAWMPFACRLSNRSVMGRTAILRQYGYDEAFPVSEDYELFSRMAEYHKLGNLPETLVLGRLHDQQTTAATAEQGKRLRMAIQRRQLSRLGTAFTESDLERHYCLARPGHPPFTPDPDYCGWAESWLRDLERSNHRAKVYPEPEFAHALGFVWAATCWRAKAKGLATGLRRFWHSELSRWAGHGAIRALLARVSGSVTP